MCPCPLWGGQGGVQLLAACVRGVAMATGMSCVTRVRARRECTDQHAVLRAGRNGAGGRADELTKEMSLRHWSVRRVRLWSSQCRSLCLGMLLGRCRNHQDGLKCHCQSKSAGGHCRSNFEHEAMMRAKYCGGRKPLSYENSCDLLQGRGAVRAGCHNPVTRLLASAMAPVYLGGRKLRRRCAQSISLRPVSRLEYFGSR